MILTKREEEIIVEWTREKQNGIENEETRGRKDKVGGEEKMKGLFMSGL